MWAISFFEDRTKQMICQKRTEIIPSENSMVIIEKQSYQVCYVVFDYDKYIITVFLNKEIKE